MLAARQRLSQKHYEAPNFRNITPSVSLGCVKTQCSYIYGEERTGHPTQAVRCMLKEVNIFSSTRSIMIFFNDIFSL